MRPLPLLLALALLVPPLAAAEPEEDPPTCDASVRTGDNGTLLRHTLVDCLPVLDVEPGTSDVCASLGASCCEVWTWECLRAVLGNVGVGRLSSEAPVAFCIGLDGRSGELPTLRADVGKSCDLGPDGT